MKEKEIDSPETEKEEYVKPSLTRHERLACVTGISPP